MAVLAAVAVLAVAVLAAVGLAVAVLAAVGLVLVAQVSKGCGWLLPLGLQ